MLARPDRVEAERRDDKLQAGVLVRSRLAAVADLLLIRQPCVHNKMKWQSSARIIIALAASLSTARVQIPLGGSSTAAVASLVESASSLPASVLTSLDRKLQSLPIDHLARLQQHVGALNEPRRVQFEQDGHRFEISEGQKALLTLAGQRFVDVTSDFGLVYTMAPAAVSDRYPTSFKHSKKELESSIYKHINIEETKKFLRDFTGFYTRYYRSPTGKQSQQMLQRTLEDVSDCARAPGTYDR